MSLLNTTLSLVPITVDRKSKGEDTRRGNEKEGRKGTLICRIGNCFFLIRFNFTLIEGSRYKASKFPVFQKLLFLIFFLENTKN